jgi:hypothetical protein
MFAKLRLSLVCLAALGGMAGGCSQTPEPQSVGGACFIDSDCATSLVCVMNRCHQTCTQSYDCPIDQPCAYEGAAQVCQLPGDTVGPAEKQDAGRGTGGKGGSTASSSARGGSGGTTSASGKGGTSSTSLTGGVTPTAGGSSTSATGGKGGTTSPDAARTDAPDAEIRPDVPVEVGSSTVQSGCGTVTTRRYFCDDFESGLDNWHRGSDGWALSTATYQSASHSATDSPSGSYAKYAKNPLLTAGYVDLARAVSPVLTFWHKLQLANRNAAVPSGSDMTNTSSCGTTYSDVAYVQISTDGGTNWTALKTYTCANNTSTWSFQQLSLAGYVGQRIRVAFRLDDTDTTYQGDGWYLDDVEIRETDLRPDGTPDGGSQTLSGKESSGCGGSEVGSRYFCDDFESGIANWMVATNGWNTENITAQSPTLSATDSPGGNYPAGAKTEMTMARSIDLTSAVWPVLTYWVKVALANRNAETPSGADMANTSSCGTTYSDLAYADISIDGGTTWTTLKTYTCMANTSTWMPDQISLISFVGKKIKLRFRLEDTNSSYVGDGWHLDDIKVHDNPLVPASSRSAQGTVALFHFDGADGSTRFADSSGTGRVAVPTGNPVISSAQSKFGGGSLYVNGNGTSQTNYVTISGGSEFVFQADFTMDWWQYLVVYPDVWGTIVGTSSFGVGWKSSGANLIIGYDSSYTAISPPSTAEWHHVALTRAGATLRAFIDGAVVYANTAFTGTKTTDGIMRLSTYSTNSDNGDLNGYIDELRVINGVAVWTDAFTPPSDPYPGN